MLTKSGVIKSGKRLAHNDSSYEMYAHDMDTLHEWRRAHIAPMQRLNMYARGRVKGVNQAIVAQRLKRIPTIISKLKDANIHCDLYSMQDIGGVRVVLEDVVQVEDFIKKTHKKTQCRKQTNAYDYISHPKPSGYRGFHLVFDDMCGNMTMPVELQVRSTLQHLWAMALESFDVMNKTNLKRGHGDRNTDMFMRYCSALFSIVENRPVMEEFAKTSVKKIISKIDGMQTTLQKLRLFTVSPDSIFGYIKQNGYYLLLLDAKSKTVNVNWYGNDIETADKQYLNAEKVFFNDPSMAVVLVEANDVNNLQRAYPSYFLDNMEFISKLEWACAAYR